jgi:hypothetical protein
MTTIGRVIDVSSAQHPNNAPINWTQVAAAGVTTAIIKATQGTTYTNPWYDRDVFEAAVAGLQVMAYHYADFTNAQAEADYFKSVAGNLAQAGDFETSTNAQWMRSFLLALGRPADQLLAYGSESTFGSVYQQLPALPWVAAYQANSPGWGVLWQFTSTATIPGIVGTVDQSAWQGSEIQYETLFGIYDPVPPPPPEETKMPLYAVNSAGTGWVIATDLSSKTGIPDAQDAQTLLKTGLYTNVSLTDQLLAAIPTV